MKNWRYLLVAFILFSCIQIGWSQKEPSEPIKREVGRVLPKFEGGIVTPSKKNGKARPTIRTKKGESKEFTTNRLLVRQDGRISNQELAILNKMRKKRTEASE